MNFNTKRKKHLTDFIHGIWFVGAQKVAFSVSEVTDFLGCFLSSVFRVQTSNSNEQTDKYHRHCELPSLDVGYDHDPHMGPT